MTYVRTTNQDNSIASAASPGALSFTTGNPPVGAFLACIIKVNNAPGTTTVASTAGAYTLSGTGGGVNSLGSAVEIWYRISTGGANERTVTATSSGGTFQMQIYQYTGNALTAVVDATNHSDGTAGTNTSRVTGTITTKNAGDLIIEAVAQTAANGGVVGWTTGTALTPPTNTNQLMVAEYIPGAIKTGYQDTGTWTTLRANGGCIASFFPAPTATSKTITGKSRLFQTVAQTISGKSRLSKTVTKTITGLANITSGAATTTQTILAKARVRATALQTIVAKSRVAKTVTKTVTGLARITKSVAKTIPGQARIRKTVTQTILGTARIRKTVTKTITAVARIGRTTTKTIVAKSRIAVSVVKTIPGMSRITRTAIRTITGVGRVAKNVTATILGKSRIARVVIATINGHSRISKTGTQTIPGRARIATSSLDPDSYRVRLYFQEPSALSFQEDDPVTYLEGALAKGAIG